MSEENLKTDEIKVPKVLELVMKFLITSIACCFAIVIIMVGGLLMTGELAELQPALYVILIVFIGAEIFWVSNIIWMLKSKGDGD